MATPRFGGGRRDPQDPTGPGDYPGGSGDSTQQGPLGPWFDPNGGERPRRGKPKPPRPLKAWPPADLDEYCLLLQHAVSCAVQSPYVKDVVGKMVEEVSRSFIRPVSMPPWVTPPFNSTPLGGSGTANTGAVLSTYVTLVEGYVPRGSWGVIRRLGQDTPNDAAGSGVADWADLAWDFALASGDSNGAKGPFVSVPAYTDFVQQRGQIEAPCETFLFVPEGTWFRFRVKATGLGAQNIVCTGLAIGWLWLIRGGRLDGSAKGVMGD